MRSPTNQSLEKESQIKSRPIDCNCPDPELPCMNPMCNNHDIFHLLRIGSPPCAHLQDHCVTHHFNFALNVYNHRTRKYLWVNKSFLQYTGMTEEECYDQSQEMFTHWVDEKDLQLINNFLIPCLNDACRKYIHNNSQKLMYQFNLALRQRNGVPATFSVNCSVAEWNEDHTPATSVNVLSNISHCNITRKMTLVISLFDDDENNWKTILSEDYLHTPTHLTTREKELLPLILKGDSASQISSKKNMSFFTVRSHWRNILQKSQCTTVHELQQLAVKKGWS
jgi:DNA-binding CsgD family transcriptional regulator